jgi:hypothetical protein
VAPQDGGVALQRVRVDGDDRAPPVMAVDPHPQRADAQLPADPPVLREPVLDGFDEDVGSEAGRREVGSDEPAQTTHGLGGEQRQGHGVEDAAILLDDAHPRPELRG